MQTVLKRLQVIRIPSFSRVRGQATIGGLSQISLYNALPMSGMTQQSMAWNKMGRGFSTNNGRANTISHVIKMIRDGETTSSDSELEGEEESFSFYKEEN